MAVFAKLKKESSYYNNNQPTIVDLFNDIADEGLQSAIEKRHMWNMMRMNRTDLADISAATYTYLVNGHANANNWLGLFKPGEKIRLRFINASAQSFFDVRIPGLKMTVVSADGQNVELVSVDEFRIGLNEVQVGLPMPPVIYRALAWAVGNQRASLLGGGGLLVTSDEAFRLGFVDELQPTDRVVERAVAWCGERLALPPGAHDFTRDLGRRTLLAVFEGADKELDGLVDVWFSPETQGAMTALVERLKKK